MLQAKTQDITNVICLPRRTRKSKAKQARTRKPRRDVVKATMAAIAMRDELKMAAAARRDIDAQILAAKSEQRYGGLRSLMLLAAISSVMVAMLVAGMS